MPSFKSYIKATVITLSLIAVTFLTIAALLMAQWHFPWLIPVIIVLAILAGAIHIMADWFEDG